MLTIRSLVRSAPRTISQLSARSFRQTQAFRIAPIASSFRLSSPISRFGAAFSTSSRKLTDDQLSVKLAQEISVEKDLGETESRSAEQKAELDEFLKAAEFSLTDTPDTQEIILTKTHVNETIKVTFSIADINNMNDEPMFDPESGEDGEAPLANQASLQGSTPRTAPEDQIEENEPEDQEMPEESFPVNLNIQIVKTGKPGAIVVDASAQYGEINVESFAYFADGNLAQASSFDAEKQRSNAYAGPPFGNLDADLQELINQYLADRGINAALADFVSDYIDYKEQREYVSWLENVKEFID
ncbi:mitochondrial glyco protein [Microthyrium microscopicum]|uniref:Mitochondrial glyco protein n=1 Tax=Microthyrium microscopicum TaxID=703497 RepID=A0A6A6U4I1_9PEZI|nr:mitochondrial glyco protein [Microthyrium microscopicum]